MKIIKDKMPVRMSNWKANQVAKISDMGVQEGYAKYVTDEDRVYAYPKPIFISSNPRMYDKVKNEYANPVTLEAGETVKLEANGKLYKVVPMRKNYEYITDIIHFELINK